MYFRPHNLRSSLKIAYYPKVIFLSLYITNWNRKETHSGGVVHILQTIDIYNDVNNQQDATTFVVY